MKNILNSYIAERKKSRVGKLRTLVALFLLSAVVASTVVWSLRFVGMTMTGIPTYEATPQTVVHRASPSEQQQNTSGGGTYKPLAVTDGSVGAMDTGTTYSYNAALNLSYKVTGVATTNTGKKYPDIGQLTDGNTEGTNGRDGTFTGFEHGHGGDTFEVELDSVYTISSIKLHYLMHRVSVTGGWNIYCPRTVEVFVDGASVSDAAYTNPNHTGTVPESFGPLNEAWEITLPDSVKGRKVKIKMTSDSDGHWIFLSEVEVIAKKTSPETQFKVEYWGYVDDIDVGGTGDANATTLDQVVDTRKNRTGEVNLANSNYGGGGVLPINGTSVSDEAQEYVNIPLTGVPNDARPKTTRKLVKLYRDSYFYLSKADHIEHVNKLAKNKDWTLVSATENGSALSLDSNHNAPISGGAIKLTYEPTMGTQKIEDTHFFDYDITCGRLSYSEAHIANIAGEAEYKGNSDVVQFLQKENYWRTWISTKTFTGANSYHRGKFNNKNFNDTDYVEFARTKGESTDAWYTTDIRISFRFSCPREIVEVRVFTKNAAKADNSNRFHPKEVKAYVSNTEFDTSGGNLLGSETKNCNNLHNSSAYAYYCKPANTNNPKMGQYVTIVLRLCKGAITGIKEVEILAPIRRTNNGGSGCGINAPYPSNINPFLAFGNANTEMPYQFHTWTNQGAGQQLNKYNKYNNYPRPDDFINGCTFGLASGTLLPAEGKSGYNAPQYSYNNGLQFEVNTTAAGWENNGSKDAVPAMFKRATQPGKRRYFTDMPLYFARTGSIHILQSVGMGDNATACASDLDKIKRVYYKIPPGLTNLKSIWSNSFWPMDSRTGAVPAESIPAAVDPLFGGLSNHNGHGYSFGSPGSGAVHGIAKMSPISDDELDHNSYFGLNFDIDFTLSNDYIGPLEYFFYGDDDMWVYLDGKLICDIGGVHSSVGEYVNLWDWLSPYSIGEHRLTFFYTERGASGSSCYVRFDLPGVTDKPKPKSVGQLLIEKESVNAPANTEFEFEVNLTSGGAAFSGTKAVSYYKDYPTFYSTQSADGLFLRAEDIEFVNGKATVKLKDKQFAIIKSLPVGASYTVREVNHLGYAVKAYADRVPSLVFQSAAPSDSATLDSDCKYQSDANTNIAAENMSRVHFYNKTGPELPSTGGSGREVFPIVGLTAVIFSTLAPIVLRGDKKRGARKNKA